MPKSVSIACSPLRVGARGAREDMQDDDDDEDDDDDDDDDDDNDDETTTKERTSHPRPGSPRPERRTNTAPAG